MSRFAVPHRLSAWIVRLTATGITMHAGGRVRLLCCVLLLCAAGRSNAQPRPWPLWQAYTQRYLDGQGRVIDHDDHERTTSEGEAYALFFALVDDDRSRFAKLLSWTEANLAGGDLSLRLPAWHWGQASSGQWKPLDENSASDADLWMAYTLIQAGRLWHNPRYDKLGRLMAERIAREEVVLIPKRGLFLLPGAHGFQTGTGAYVLNPSYLPPFVLISLAKTLPHGPWAGILKTLPELLALPSTQGFAMDWVSAGPDGVHPSGTPAQPPDGASQGGPAGSYDAIRVYLWLGLADPATLGLRFLLSAMLGMAHLLRTAAIPPRIVGAQGVVISPDAPVGFSAAVIPFLSALGMRSQMHMQEDRLVAARDAATGLSSNPSKYYDENLALFSTAWSEKRYRFGAAGELHVNWK